MRILLTGGGTGGHIYPLIAVANQVREIYQQKHNQIRDLEFYFLGANGLATQEFDRYQIKRKIIITGKWRRYFSFYNLVDIFKVPIGFIQSLWHLFLIMPDVIFSKGGFDSVPVVIVGWIFRIPIIIHESDSIPGLANRIGAKFAKRIALAFEGAAPFFKKEKVALLGNPIRQEIVKICTSKNPQDKEEAKEFFQVQGDRPVILILGGSQGAQRINELILKALYDLLKKYEIIHQCGIKNQQQIKELFSQSMPSYYHLFSFLEEKQIAQAYLIADLIISRAGAGSIFEISACGKPSIVIPLPGSAGDHQRQNAFSFAQYGATIVIEEDNITPNLLVHGVKKILENSDQKALISQNAKKFSILDSATYIAEEIINLGING